MTYCVRRAVVGPDGTASSDVDVCENTLLTSEELAVQKKFGAWEVTPATCPACHNRIAIAWTFDWVIERLREQLGKAP